MEQDAKTQLLAAAVARRVGRENTAEASGEIVGDFDDIPVQLRFDIGGLDISLGQLRRLGSGAVLGTSRTLDELVEIRANGRVIGRGTLVDIAGTVGVRIVSLVDDD